MTIKLTVEQMGRLLYKAAHEPRRNAKRYMKDLGGTGSAEELDATLEKVEANQAAIDELRRLERQQELIASKVKADKDQRLAEMVTAIRIRMEDLSMSQKELADKCGVQQGLISDYLSLKKPPGGENLVKMAAAVGCTWKLTPES